MKREFSGQGEDESRESHSNALRSLLNFQLVFTWPNTESVSHEMEQMDSGAI